MSHDHKLDRPELAENKSNSEVGQKDKYVGLVIKGLLKPSGFCKLFFLIKKSSDQVEHQNFGISVDIACNMLCDH